MKLKDLLAGITPLSVSADLETEISRISYDSRTTAPGDVFVAMTGFATDGHAYIPKALAAGAAAVVCERIPEGGDIPCVQVEDARRALAVMAANFYGHPADDMTMVAVTGTNGKTTTTYLVKAILERELGARVGLIGTNQDMIGDEVIPTERTTPESLELQELFARMRAAGCTHVVMEASSHALFLKRVYGIRFAVGIFTNLTQDHLDFHKTMEAYCDAKSILFRNCGVGVVNGDDPWTERLMAGATCRTYTYAVHGAADLRAENVRLAADHIAFDAVTADGRTPVQVGIPGGFMVYNTLDALGAALALGVPLEKSAEALALVPHVKGRVEVVPTPGEGLHCPHRLLPHPRQPGEHPQDREGLRKGPHRGPVRLRRGPGPDEAAQDGADRGGSGGLRDRHLRQPPDRGPGGHHRRHPAGAGGHLHALSGDLRPGGGHPLGDGPRPARRCDRPVRQGPRDLSGDRP